MTTATTPRADRKNYHHGHLREQLLEAVRQLVEAHGADAFSMAEACRLAGVSTAAPYKHFKDRHDILRGVALLAMTRLRETMQAAADAYLAKDPRRIVAFGQSYVDFARAEPGIFRMMFGLTEGHARDPDLARAGDDTTVLVERVVAEHLDARQGDPQVKLRAYALWCFVHGHSFLCLDSKLPGEMSKIEETALLRLVGDAMLPAIEG
ncbi:transcriptional regulator, TetR family [Jannaschia faecimaris]|uniref:Transcriptional regulator, TetR family n=1 Tax=Jannaschia faecimaris TaxID=1244108 RepID=A0A1H3U3G6_9RHOB|nr:TetR/AcrR family transcriptional regulator [Jannaschia faecimaris]SDZ56385.1 transcriptional regulator, TetR family [Jannaschia faecimaris]